MRVLIQRVKKASVYVNGAAISAINRGLLLFVGIGREDSQDDYRFMANKISKMRIFEDDQGKMNKDIKQVDGQILSISQFTLYADTRKGNRPGFDKSAEPETARDYWHQFNNLLREKGILVREGVFAANMDVEIINDGPVTIWLESGEGQGA
jgi:D-tyrosyl-tRNA(Tyr) deacylase